MATFDIRWRNLDLLLWTGNTAVNAMGLPMSRTSKNIKRNRSTRKHMIVSYICRMLYRRRLLLLFTVCLTDEELFITGFIIMRLLPLPDNQSWNTWFAVFGLIPWIQPSRYNRLVSDITSDRWICSNAKNNNARIWKKKTHFVSFFWKYKWQLYSILAILMEWKINGKWRGNSTTYVRWNTLQLLNGIFPEFVHG